MYVLGLYDYCDFSNYFDLFNKVLYVGNDEKYNMEKVILT